MKRVVLSAVMGAMLVSGCVATVKQSQSYDEAAAAAQMQPGDSTIIGSALMRQVGGGVVTCAGNRVGLIPVTAYTTERMNLIYGNDYRGHVSALGGKKIENDDPRYRHYMGESICDAQGRFKFSNLKHGSYYVITTILWHANPNSIIPEGGALMQRVTIAPGETREIVLAP